MAYSDLIIDQVTPQVFLLAFAGLEGGLNVLSSDDGDFTTDPITINRPFFTGSDFKCGCVAASTLSFTLENSTNVGTHIGRYSDFGFGEAQAYIGVQYSKTYDASAGTTSDIVVNGATAFTIRFEAGNNDEMMIDSTEIPDTSTTRFAAVLTTSANTPGVVYFVDDNGKARSYEVATSTDTVLGDPYDCFLLKAQSPLDGKVVHLDAYSFDDGEDAPYSSYTVYENNYITIYQIAAVGVYDIARPNTTSIRTINVVDAFDKAHRLDRQAADFRDYVMSFYPSGDCTVQDMVDKLHAYFGEGCNIYYAGTIPTVTVHPGWLNGYYTVRDIVGWLAAVIACNAWYDNDGTLRFIHLPPYDDPPFLSIPATQIVSGSYERMDYYVHEVDGIGLYRVDGSFWHSTPWNVYGNNYIIQGNQLIDEYSLQDADFVAEIGHYTYNTYNPLSIALTEFDPMLLPGSLVEVENIYTGATELIPVWEFTIVWCGKTMGTLSAGGNSYRLAE